MNNTELLIKSLQKIETTGSEVDRDLMTYLLGMLPEDILLGMSFNRNSVRVWLKDCFKMSALLEEMHPRDSRVTILLVWHEYEDRGGDLGGACKMLLRMCQ